MSNYKSLAALIYVTQTEEAFVLRMYSWKTLTIPGDTQIYYEAMNANGEKIYAARTDEMGMTAAVTVDKDVTEKDAGNAIEAKYSGTSVTVKGNVIEDGDGSAINAQPNATIIVFGDVRESGDGSAISAENNATVKVHGNVTESGSQASNAIDSASGATVIVEGLVTGNLNTNGKESNTSGTIYIGELNGNIKEGSELEKIHYLIGVKDGQNNIFTVTGEIVSTDTVDGAKEQGYYYTTTAENDKLSGKSFIIKSTDSRKKIRIDEAYAGVTIVNEADGTVKLTLGSDFKGGIQSLNLIFEDIARQLSSDGYSSSRILFTGTAGSPVTNGRWTQNADGTWSYAAAYSFSNTWGYIANPNDADSASWYYFDRNGKMLTGWQKLYWNGASIGVGRMFQENLFNKSNYLIGVARTVLE